jgi:hypothetical protein
VLCVPVLHKISGETRETRGQVAGYRQAKQAKGREKKKKEREMTTTAE